MEAQAYLHVQGSEEEEESKSQIEIIHVEGTQEGAHIEVVPDDDSVGLSFGPSDFGATADQRSRVTWSEDRISSLLDVYIHEHAAYLKAKAERQVTEFHEYVGRLVGSDGNIVAGLLKNLGREYRKAWARCNGVEPIGGLRLRKSRELCQKFEKYYEVYSRIGLRELRPRGVGRVGTARQAALGSSSSGGSGSGSGRTPQSQRSSASMPRIKKLKKAAPRLQDGTVLEHMLSPGPQPMVPPMVMSDKHWQEYIEVMREQNSALVEIGKELRLMRMGYFTEHELAMDA